ncbi:MAG: oxidoreductase [Patulibacter sp.]
MSRWTADDIPDQSGRRVVITGANSGLGLESATQLARRGAEVILACRDPARGAAALATVRAAATGVAPSLIALDLADLESVAAAASEIASRWPSIDVLMNNAGLMAIPERQTTAQGYEMQFGVNVLAHTALTLRLLPSLLAAPAPRVVALGSIMHLFGTINFDDLMFERRYSAWPVYSQSKLANVMFALELDRRAKAAGLPLRAIAAHPGYSATQLQSTGPLDGGRPLARISGRIGALATPLIGQPARMGALGQLRAATDRSLRGGEYVGPTSWAQLRGYPVVFAPSRRARDVPAAARLWEHQEQLLGLTFAGQL